MKLGTTYVLLMKNLLNYPNPFCSQWKGKGILEDFWGSNTTEDPYLTVPL